MWIRCSSRRVNLDDVTEYVLQGLQIKFIKSTGEDRTLSFDTAQEAQEVINLLDTYFSEEAPFLDLTSFFIGKRPNEFLT